MTYVCELFWLTFMPNYGSFWLTFMGHCDLRLCQIMGHCDLRLCKIMDHFDLRLWVIVTYVYGLLWLTFMPNYGSLWLTFIGHCDLRLWVIVTYVCELLSHVRTLSIGHARRHQRQVFTNLLKSNLAWWFFWCPPFKISLNNPYPIQNDHRYTQNVFLFNDKNIHFQGGMICNFDLVYLLYVHFFLEWVLYFVHPSHRWEKRQ